MLLGACAIADPNPSLPPAELLPVPSAAYSSLAWLADDELYVAVTSEDARGESVYELARVDGDTLQPVALPDVPGCTETSVMHISALPDGRLGSSLSCSDALDASAYSIRANDPTAGEDEELARVDLIPIDYTFAPDMSRGLVARSSQLCAATGWLIAGGAEPLDLELSDGDVTMNTADEPLDGTADCTPFGRAQTPAWSPDGETIALFASPSSIGVEGTARLAVPWNLYLVAIDGLTPRLALEDVRSAYQLRWSPDGRWLAFSADTYGSQTGTFVYEPATGEVRQLHARPLFGLSWAPDGTRLAGLLDDDDILNPERTIVVLSISTD